MNKLLLGLTAVFALSVAAPAMADEAKDKPAAEAKPAKKGKGKKAAKAEKPEEKEKEKASK